MPGKEEDLQDEANWNFKAAERRGPVANRRTIVSVAFPADDFALIASAARRSEMKISEYIRVAAVERAQAMEAWMVPPVITISMTDSARLPHEIPVTIGSSPQPRPILVPA